MSLALVVEKCKAIVHVRAFLAGEPLNALIVDRFIAVTGDFHPVAGYFQQVTQPQEYTQVYALFRHSLRRYTAAVEAAMWRVNLNQAAFPA